MVHGEAVVKPVFRSHAGKAGKPMRPQNNLAMTDFGGLAETCGSRRENTKRAVGERDQRSLSLSERVAVQHRNLKVDASSASSIAAVDPKLYAAKARDRLRADVSVRGLGDNALRARHSQGVAKRGCG